MLTLETVTSAPPPDPDPAFELEPWRDAEGTICARVFRAGRAYLIRWGDTSLFQFDPDSPNVHVWPLNGAALAPIADSFARRIQPLLLQATGHLVLHASAASAGRAVTVFAGLSGTGKSTLASHLRAFNCTQWADDAVVVDVSGPKADVIALPFLPASADLERVATAGQRAHVAAYVLLVRDAGAPVAGRVEAITDASALAHVLTHAHAFFPAGGVDLIESCARLIESAPVFRVVFDHAPDGADQLAAAMASWMRAREVSR